MRDFNSHLSPAGQQAPSIAEDIADRTERKRSANKSARHVRLYYALLESQAWASLTGTEIAAYILFCKAYNGSNNGRITMSNRQVQQGARCSAGTAAAIVRKLQDVGLLRLTGKGIYTRRGDRRRAAEWRLTDFRCDITRELPTREWKRWKPDPTVHPEKRYRSARKTLPFSQESGTKNGPKKTQQNQWHERSVTTHDRSARKAHIELPCASAPPAAGRPPAASTPEPKSKKNPASETRAKRSAAAKPHPQRRAGVAERSPKAERSVAGTEQKLSRSEAEKSEKS